MIVFVCLLLMRIFFIPKNLNSYGCHCGFIFCCVVITIDWYPIDIMIVIDIIYLEPSHLADGQRP